jgi:hypothetical protein
MTEAAPVDGQCLSLWPLPPMIVAGQIAPAPQLLALLHQVDA